jgi:hypothetical protein
VFHRSTREIASAMAASPRPTDPVSLGRAARSDLDLIESVDQALETLHGKWKVYLQVFMAMGAHRQPLMS